MDPDGLGLAILALVHDITKLWRHVTASQENLLQRRLVYLAIDQHCFNGFITIAVLPRIYNNPLSHNQNTMSASDSTSQHDQQAGVVAGHLPDGYTHQFDGESGDGPGPAVRSKKDTEQESSLKLQGGDIHRDLFKLTARGRLQQHQRAATFSHPVRTSSEPGEDSANPSDLQQPGGFRREHILRRADNVVIPGTRNFVEFLNLYGQFAGEDLAESDTDDDEDEADQERQRGVGESTGERRPLLSARKSIRGMRNKQGDAGTLKTFFTLIKAFVGTGIMFLPKAFANGGMVFSSITMLIISLASVWAFHLLLMCKEKHGGGYGELGGTISGKKFRTLILASITLSQLGFVCAGIVFVAENLTSFFSMSSVIST